MDGETLYRIYCYLPYREQIASILQSSAYWYERTMNLVGRQLETRPQANWKLICNVFLSDKDELGEVTYLSTLVDLDTLLVAEEILGPIQLSDDYYGLLYSVCSLSVLLYLMAKLEQRELSLIFWDVLCMQLSSNNDEIIDYLLSIAPSDLPECNMTILLTMAINIQRPDILMFLCAHADEDTQYDHLLRLQPEPTTSKRTYMPSRAS